MEMGFGGLPGGLAGRMPLPLYQRFGQGRAMAQLLDRDDPRFEIFAEFIPRLAIL